MDVTSPEVRPWNSRHRATKPNRSPESTETKEARVTLKSPSLVMRLVFRLCEVSIYLWMPYNEGTRKSVIPNMKIGSLYDAHLGCTISAEIHIWEGYGVECGQISRRETPIRPAIESKLHEDTLFVYDTCHICEVFFPILLPG